MSDVIIAYQLKCFYFISCTLVDCASIAVNVVEMASLLRILSVDNPVFRGYLYYNGLLVLKCMSMSLLTIRERKRKRRKVSEYTECPTLSASGW